MQDTSSVVDPDRALTLLDFTAVRERVADHAGFPAARTMALELTPSFSVATVQRLQDETSEGVVLLENRGDLDLHSSEDPSAAVQRASLDGVLAGLELLAVATSLDVQQRARAALSDAHQNVPTLSGLAQGIPDLRELQSDIRSAIGPRGEVVDAATPTLGPLRQQAREAYHRVAEALERIIQSSVGSEALQDQVVSVRSDRLVVQVKTEQRHRVPGIVHDSSNSGATLFIEPFATVDLCNSWRELVLEEERETERVLRDLSALVGAAASDITLGAGLTAQIDFILARARYSASLHGNAAITPDSDPGGRSEDRPPRLRLLRARHPLLGGDAVPITLHLGPDWTVLVITGPNTGGKTVAMKTVGILSLMHQSGLHIPADEGSVLPVFDGIFADVGDQQSIQRSVSTFSSHMSNVIDILSRATTSSLVLMDEIGTSTDPEEGSALAKGILGHLAEQTVTTVATTHYKTVAAYAEATAGMMNASVELDPATLRPTYHLTLGVPGRSYAMSVADHMGLPAEIMEKARSLMEPQYLRFEDWLSELQNERTQLQQRLQEAEEAQAHSEATRRELDAQLNDLQTRRAEIQDSMRREVSQQFDEVRKDLRKAEATLSWQTSSESVGDARQAVEVARADFRQIESAAEEAPRQPGDGRLEVGDLVECHGLGVRGKVVSVPEQGSEIEVSLGKVNVRLDASRLSRIEDHEDQGTDSAAVRYDLGPSLASIDLDLRGRRAEEALVQVEQFLDKALRDGLSSVRIIHGKGTGALRAAVRELLEGHPMARSFVSEAPNKGGDGATLVELM